MMSFLLTGAVLGVVGAGASAGGAIGKYMKTKDGKKRGDSEMKYEIKVFKTYILRPFGFRH